MRRLRQALVKREVTREQLCEALDYDPESGVFRWKTGRQRPGAITGTLGRRGYIVVDFRRLKFYAHRLAWLFVYGRWPDGLIDHINGDKTDNRIGNLREASAEVNMQNIRRAYRNSKSGLLGASFRNGRWHAKIRVDGVDRLLGKFATAEEAHAAYVTAKRLAHPGCSI